MTQETPEDLVKLLSHRPRDFLEGMIPVDDCPITPVVIQRPSMRSSGKLNVLPLELLHYTFNNLDFQSLSRLSRVSLQNKDAVESLPAFQDLIQYAPHALRALSKINLLSLHSAVLLRSTLKSQSCISCREFGPYLFLPTCERCCFQCLCFNQSLWVVPVKFAQECFNIPPRELKKIPIMRGIPGRYKVGLQIERRRYEKLVSVRTAKEFGLQINGSTPRSILPYHLSASELRKTQAMNWYRDAPLSPLPANPSTLPTIRNSRKDNFCGMASTIFPSLLPDNTLDYGRWCRGCEWMYKHPNKNTWLTIHLRNELVPSRCDPHYVFLGKYRRARSTSDFLAHVTECYGVGQLVSLTPE
ncbi:hypothetical protein FQN57_000326 [Myotisia sp. PD_48]|nr:hypothetical protein FQN57_000326 [Myotisia sp. PD_48]